MLNTIVEVDTPEIPRENNQKKILVFTLLGASVASTTRVEQRTSKR
jgi:hypothetical protein